MGRRKKVDIEMERMAANGVDGELVSDMDREHMHLLPIELSQLQLHQVRMQLQSNLMEKLKLQDDLLAIDYRNKHAEIRGHMKSAEDSRSEAARDYNAQIASIESRLGIRMAEYSVDDITGILRHESEFK